MEHPTFKRIPLLLPGQLRVDLMFMLNIPLTLHLLYPHHAQLVVSIKLGEKSSSQGWSYCDENWQNLLIAYWKHLFIQFGHFQSIIYFHSKAYIRLTTHSPSHNYNYKWQTILVTRHHSGVKGVSPHFNTFSDFENYAYFIIYCHSTLINHVAMSLIKIFK